MAKKMRWHQQRDVDVIMNARTEGRLASADTHVPVEEYVVYCRRCKQPAKKSEVCRKPRYKGYVHREECEPARPDAYETDDKPMPPDMA